MSVGENIKRIRMKKGMTQQQVADIIGVTYQNISQYERGLRTPKAETLFKLATALNVDLWDLVDWDYSVEPGHFIGEEWKKWQDGHNFHDDNIQTRQDNSIKKSIVEKWRELDDFGKRAVKAVLDVEFDRIQADISKEDQ